MKSAITILLDEVSISKLHRDDLQAAMHEASEATMCSDYSAKHGAQ